MTTLSMSVPDSVRAFVDEQVARGGYRDAAEYVQSLIDAERRRQLHGELAQQLLEGVRGPAEELTNAQWDAIEREGLRLIAQRQGK